MTKSLVFFLRLRALLLSCGVLLSHWFARCRGVDFPVYLVREVFTNEDGSRGVLHLLSSDPTLTYDQITRIYQRRLRVEEYHKSLKHNASLTKSPTRTVTTQTNHFFASVYAFIKLEMLKMKTSINHFALKGKSIFQLSKQHLKNYKNYSLSINMNRAVRNISKLLSISSSLNLSHPRNPWIKILRVLESFSVSNTQA